jgi:hypothetical protein
MDVGVDVDVEVGVGVAGASAGIALQAVKSINMKEAKYGNRFMSISSLMDHFLHPWAEMPSHRTFFSCETQPPNVTYHPLHKA